MQVDIRSCNQWTFNRSNCDLFRVHKYSFHGASRKDIRPLTFLTSPLFRSKWNRRSHLYWGCRRVRVAQCKDEQNALFQVVGIYLRLFKHFNINVCNVINLGELSIWCRSVDGQISVQGIYYFRGVNFDVVSRKDVLGRLGTKPVALPYY